MTEISSSSCMKSVAVAIATALERSCIIVRTIAFETGYFVIFAVLIHSQPDAAVHANVFFACRPCWLLLPTTEVN